MQRLEKAGVEVSCADLYTPEGAARLWKGVGSVVHASASGVSRGKEAVVSVSDLGSSEIIQAAVAAKVDRFVLLHPPTPDVCKSLEHSPLPYTLLCPELTDHEITFLGGAHGRVLERRRLVVFMPLPRVVDAAVFAASGGFERLTLTLPAQVRRYSDVLGAVEQLLSLPQTPVADPLLAELVMGSPYKLVTPGVARALGLEFPTSYLKKVFSQPEG